MNTTIERVTLPALNRPATGASSCLKASAIGFTTRHSTYLFTWIQGQREGVLTCLSGTFSGSVVMLPVEEFRDMAWVRSVIDIPGQFTCTEITSVDRGAAS